MGSRSLRSRSLHEPLSGWPRTLLAKVKQQRRALPAFLKLEWADPFWKSRPEKDPFDAHPALSCALHATVVIPMAAKDLAGCVSHAQPGHDCRQAVSAAFWHRSA